MARKVGQQILLSPHVKERLLGLALVRQEAQAEVARVLVEAALPAFEQAHAAHLQELYQALDGMKVNRLEALAEMTEVKLRPDGQKRRLTVADLKTSEGAWRKTFPVPLSRKA